MQGVKIGVSSRVLVFRPECIGARVLRPEQFMSILEAVVAAHDFASERTPGQGYIAMPQESYRLVSSGVGKRTEEPSNCILRGDQGRVESFLNRRLSEPVVSLTVVVYTRDAYLNDPDVGKNPAEVASATASDATHFMVEVIASAGDDAPFALRAFLASLAGDDKGASGSVPREVRELARAIQLHDDTWMVVAD